MITLADAARVTGGQWLAQPLPEGTPLRGGAFDTRALDGAEIFFALAGEGGDGHDHLGKLAGTPVKLAVVGREAPAPGFEGALLRTGDPLAALAALARAWVGAYRPKVVAVTGSYGKTTAKEVIAHVLAGTRQVLKSPGSQNNEIGVPIALLRLDGSQDTAVLEFSARKPGDIDYLGRIAPPDVAVLLTVGQAHIGVFGSQEAIFRSKGEIFHHLRPGGLAVVGEEPPRLRELAASHRTVSFGRERGDFRAEGIALDGEGRQRFTGVHGETRLALSAGMPGPHGCDPVLAAWAVARELGVPDEAVAARGGVDPGQKGRMRLLRAPGGAVVIDDAYNASPETVVNLIETLNERPERDKVLVLGPLAELEEGWLETARAISARLVPPLGRCLVYDPRTPLLHDRLRAGASGVTVEWIDRQPALIAALRELDAPGRVIGIKGARSAHMERFVQAMLGVPVACARHPCSLLRYCTDCEALSGT
jgi:UDP-N-acetylmuramoyl-tripeptide--D-alanyl-D-alanine ligase